MLPLKLAKFMGENHKKNGSLKSFEDLSEASAA